MDDATKAELLALMNNTDNILHTIKRIMASTKSGNYKTVNVTTVIDGQELTFKTEASEFHRCPSSYYHASNIANSDREKFKKLYGGHAEYYPKDIVKITYGKTILYEK